MSVTLHIQIFVVEIDNNLYIYTMCNELNYNESSTVVLIQYTVGVYMHRMYCTVLYVEIIM